MLSYSCILTPQLRFRSGGSGQLFIAHHTVLRITQIVYFWLTNRFLRPNWYLNTGCEPAYRGTTRVRPKGICHRRSTSRRGSVLSLALGDPARGGGAALEIVQAATLADLDVYEPAYRRLGENRWRERTCGSTRCRCLRTNRLPRTRV